MYAIQTDIMLCCINVVIFFSHIRSMHRSCIKILYHIRHIDWNTLIYLYRTQNTNIERKYGLCEWPRNYRNGKTRALSVGRESGSPSQRPCCNSASTSPSSALTCTASTILILDIIPPLNYPTIRTPRWHLSS